MVHLAIGFVVLALTCIALTVFSLLVPPTVDVWFAVGSFVALGTSAAFLAYVVRQRL
jgi:hypothetical protein